MTKHTEANTALGQWIGVGYAPNYSRDVELASQNLKAAEDGLYEALKKAYPLDARVTVVHHRGSFDGRVVGWDNEPMAPIPLRSPEKAAYEARKCLRELLTTPERGEAINAVGALIEKSAAPAPHQQAAQPALNPSPLMRSCGVHAQSAALASACATPPSPQQAAQGGERAIEISPEDTEVLQEIGRQITANPGVPVTIPREVADRVKALAPNPAIVGAVDRCASEHWQRRYAAIQSIVQGWADYGRAREKARLAVCHENNKLRKANEQLRAAARAAQGERAGVGLTAGTELNVLMDAVRRLGCDKTNAEILASLGIVTTEGGWE